MHPYTCDTLPLDNSKTYSHPALLYITWRLIQDSKIRKEESLELKFSARQVPGTLKLRQDKRSQLKIFANFDLMATFQIQMMEEGFEVENSASRKRSPIYRKRMTLSLAFKNHQIQASGMS